jgi:hypothetical protein
VKRKKAELHSLIQENAALHLRKSVLKERLVVMDVTLNGTGSIECEYQVWVLREFLK